jgi:hypothetical protein
MKILNKTCNARRLKLSFVIILLIFSCKEEKTKINIDQSPNTTETISSEDIIWHIKAFHPDGKLLDVKAIDAKGNKHDVKAIQNSDQTSLMDVKAFVNGKILPVKVLVSEDKFMPVKAIDEDGTILDVKAIREDGKILDVKGVSQSGNVIHINAINTDGAFYNIEAISPKGWINDIKGIKMMKTHLEMTINGVDVYAHIKSIPKANM